MEKSAAPILNTFSLVEIMASVSSVMRRTYENKTFWVRCELVKLNLHLASGHCYVELAERNETTFIAQCKGIIWAEQYLNVRNKFLSVVHEEINSGMKVLFQCSINFHPIHGFSLYILDVEPSFTLGEMARMKNDSIKKLMSENIFDRNKSTHLPLLPKRIAVISVESSRGYQDFISTLTNYDKHYAIELFLFEATLQGDNAIPTIKKALQKIKLRVAEFDVVTIIRGGAGDTGLSCYDEYELAKEIAIFPLPVVTGIGHATNETVSEMVAFKNCITPTAAANFFLEKFTHLDNLLENIKQKLITTSQYLVKNTSLFFEESVLFLNQSCNNILEKNHLRVAIYFNDLSTFSYRDIDDKSKILEYHANVIRNIPGRQLINNYKISLTFIGVQLQNQFQNLILAKKTKMNLSTLALYQTTLQIERHHHELELLQTKIQLLNPKNTLLRGYSITRKNGKAITSASEINPGDILETTLSDGKITSHTQKS